jgi:uncharacterized protein (DUF58 family)
MSTTTPLSAPERVLRRLEWHVIRRLDGRLQGDYRTLLRGPGIDFADLREYEPGDDVRHIDWNVTARLDTPFVRQYHADRELTAWLLLDRSPSMSFGPVDRSKDAVLTDLAGTLARLLTRGGNKVGAVLYNNAVERTIPPASGRNHVLHLAHQLLRPAVATGTSTDLTGLMRHALTTITRRSLVIVVSDFISEPGWERPLAMLSQRHELVAIRLVDRRESELPDVGTVAVQDAETGEVLYVDTGNPEFRRRMAELSAERNAELLAAARRAGVQLDTVSTEEDLVAALIRIVERRRAQRRGAAPVGAGR